MIRTLLFALGLAVLPAAAALADDPPPRPSTECPLPEPPVILT